MESLLSLVVMFEHLLLSLPRAEIIMRLLIVGSGSVL